MLKKMFSTIGVLFVLMVGCSVLADSGDDVSASSDDTTYADAAVADLEEAADEEAVAADDSAAEQPAKKAKPEPKFSPGQANAIAAAQDHLDYSAFSKAGLVKQLKFEDYRPKDAVFAANHIKVNWNKQAVASAKDYLEYSSFSKAGLITQLEFEGFTRAQATYGANRAY
jgi:hypothetical protein